MKKSIVTIALFSLVLVATSFTTPETTNVSLTTANSIVPPTDGTGGQSVGGGRKQDIYKGDSSLAANFRQPTDGTGGQSVGGGRKQD